MHKDCLVSIIIPVFNSEDYIVLAIESVIKQSFKEWEIKQIVNKSWGEDLEWMFTVATLKDAKLLIKNDFDFNLAFGGQR